MDWIFGEADQNAKAIKKKFIEIAKSDLPAETKYNAYSVLYKKAHVFMSR